jgi:hypothetical protein
MKPRPCNMRVCGENCGLRVFVFRSIRQQQRDTHFGAICPEMPTISRTPGRCNFLLDGVFSKNDSV